MPPRSPEQQGYSSIDEYKAKRAELKALLDKGTINAIEYRKLLDGPKVDVDSFFTEKLIQPVTVEALPPVVPPVVAPTAVAPTPPVAPVSPPKPPPLRTPAPKPVTPPSAISEAIGKKARESLKGAVPPSVPYGEVLSEYAEDVRSRVEGPRTVGGDRTSLLVAKPVVGQEAEPTGLAEAFKRQEVLFPEDRKAIQEGGGASAAMNRLFTSEDPTGRVVESFPVWLGRILGTSSEAVAAIGESALTGEDVKTTFERRLKRGRGLAGAGADLATAIANELYPEDEKTRAFVESRLTLPLFMTGLAGDFIIPIVPGLGQATKAARIAASGEKIFTKLAGKSSKVAGIYEDFLKPFILGADTAAQRAILRFSTNRDNVSDTVKILTEGLQKNADAATRLGISETVTPKVTEAAFIDAFQRAGKLPNGQSLQREMLDFYNSLPTGVRGKPAATVFEEGQVTFDKFGSQASQYAEGGAEIAKAAEDLVSSSFLRLAAQKQLSDSAAYVLSKNPDVIVGGYSIPAREAKKIADQVSSIGQASDVVTQARLAKGKNPIITLDPATEQKIADLGVNIDTPKIIYGVKDGKPALQVRLNDWNKWVEDTTLQLVKQNPTAKLAEKAKTSTVIGDVGEIAQEVLPTFVGKPVAAAKDAFGKFKKMAAEVVPSIKKAAQKEDLTPEQRYLLERVSKKIGSVDDSFKFKVNQGIKEGKSRSKAYSDAILEGYSDTKIFEPIAEKATDIPKPKDLQKDLLNDFLATIFGGDEKVVQSSKTLFGTSVPGIDPIAFRKALEQLDGKENVYSGIKKEFDALVDAGDSEGIVKFLGQLHKSLEGKTLFDLGAAGKIAETSVSVPSSRYLDALNYTYINRKATDLVSEAMTQTAGKFVKELRATLDSFPQKEIEDTLKRFLEVDHPLPFIEDAFKETKFSDKLRKSMIDFVKKAEGFEDRAVEARNIAEKLVDMIASDRNLYGKGKTLPAEFREDMVRELTTQLVAVSTRSRFKILGSPSANFPAEFRPPIPYGIGGKPISDDDLIKQAVNLADKGVSRTSVELAKTLRQTDLGKIVIENLQDSRNLAAAGRSIDNLKSIPKTNLADIDFNRSVGDVVSKIKQLDAKAESLSPRAQKLLAYVLTPNGREAAITQTLEAGQNVVKQGLLAGAALPNFAYHAQNLLTAPMIINATLGGKRAAQAVGDLFFLDPKVNATVDELFGFRPGIKISDKAEKGYAIKTPTGKVYTPQSLAQMIAENGISQTRDQLDLSKNLLQDFAKWSGKNLRGQDKKVATEFIREFNPLKPNAWFEMANYFDTRFRTGVLKRSLEEGKSEAQAIQDARDALFDYSKISQFEKDTLGKLFWFYSFERSAITQAAKNLLTNPKAYVMEQRVKNAFSPQEKEVHSAISEYRDNSAFLGLMDNGKDRYYLYGQAGPQADAIAKGADYLGALFGILEPAGVQRAARTALGRAAARPGVSIPMTALGYDINYGEISEPTNYVDPRILGWLRASPTADAWFRTYVNLEPLPPAELTDKNITIDGLAYRIPFNDNDSKRNYNYILELAKTVGMERAMKDYAPVIVGEESGEYTPGTLEVDDPMIEFLRAIGVVKVEPAKTGEEVRSDIRTKIEREIGEQ